MKLSPVKLLSYTLGIVMTAVLVIALAVGLSCEVQAQTKHKSKGKISTVQKGKPQADISNGTGYVVARFFTVGSGSAFSLRSTAQTIYPTYSYVASTDSTPLPENAECKAENLKLALALAAEMLTDPNEQTMEWGSLRAVTLTPGVWVAESPLTTAELKRLEAEATARRLKQEADEIEAKSKTVQWIKAVQQACRAKPVEF